MIIGINGKKQSGKDTVGKIIQAFAEYYRGKQDYETPEQFVLKYLEGSVELENPVFQIKKFAGKLKDVISLVTGIPVEDMEKEEVKNKILPEEFWVYKIKPYKRPYELVSYSKYKHIFEDGWDVIKPTLRYYLQYIGTDLFRKKIHPDIWVNALMREYTENDKWIITDMRFRNEYASVKRKGGITVKIVRNTDGKDNHESETDLDDVIFDYVIENNGSIKELINRVKMVLLKEKII